MARAAPCWLSVPRKAVLPEMDNSVPIWMGSPALYVTQPNWSWLQACELPPVFPPPGAVVFFEQAAPAIATTLASATTVNHLDLRIPPPSERHPSGTSARAGMCLAARRTARSNELTKVPSFGRAVPPSFRLLAPRYHIRRPEAMDAAPADPLRTV